MNYLIAGTSNYLINEEIKKIIGDEDYTKIDYLDTTMDEIVVEASYNDLFGSKKNIIVKNANLFMEKNEAATKNLEKYLENPNSNTTLIFVCEKVNERLKIVSIISFLNVKKQGAYFFNTLPLNGELYKPHKTKKLKISIIIYSLSYSGFPFYFLFFLIIVLTSFLS